MFISSPLIREGGWGLGGGWGRAFSNLPSSPQPHSVAMQEQRSRPLVLEVRDHGIWVLAGSSPSSDSPQLCPQLLGHCREREMLRLNVGGGDGFGLSLGVLPAELLPCSPPRALTDGPELLIFSTLHHFSTFCHLPSSAHHFYSCHRRNAPSLALEGGTHRTLVPSQHRVLVRGDAVPGCSPPLAWPLHLSLTSVSRGTPLAPSYSLWCDLGVN